MSGMLINCGVPPDQCIDVSDSYKDPNPTVFKQLGDSDLVQIERIIVVDGCPGAVPQVRQIDGRNCQFPHPQQLLQGFWGEIGLKSTFDHGTMGNPSEDLPVARLNRRIRVDASPISVIFRNTRGHVVLVSRVLTMFIGKRLPESESAPGSLPSSTICFANQVWVLVVIQSLQSCLIENGFGMAGVIDSTVGDQNELTGLDGGFILQNAIPGYTDAV